jgi:hypothetical protein
MPYLCVQCDQHGAWPHPGPPALHMILVASCHGDALWRSCQPDKKFSQGHSDEWVVVLSTFDGREKQETGTPTVVVKAVIIGPGCHCVTSQNVYCDCPWAIVELYGAGVTLTLCRARCLCGSIQIGTPPY